MCGGSKPKRRPPRDLQAEQLAAERKATEAANSEIAYRKGRRRQSSLLANVGGAAGLTGSVISQNAGKDTLGG